MEEHMGGNHRSNGGRGSDNYWDLGAVVRFACNGPSSAPTNGDPFARFVPPPPPTNNPFTSSPLHQPLAQLHQVPHAMEWQRAPNLPLPTDLVTVVVGGGSGQAISVAPPPQPEDLLDAEACKEKVVLWESLLTVDDLFQESFNSTECNEKEKVVLWESPLTVDDIFQELFDSQKPPKVQPAAPQPSLPAPAPAPVPSVELPAAGDSPLPVPDKTAPSSGGAAAGSSRRRTKRRKKDMKVTPSVKLPAGEQPLAGPDKTVPSSVGGDAAGSSNRGTKTRNKDMEMTRMRNGPLRLDSWAWRKYGEKPMKGSEYLRSYYKCTSDKECPARRYVDRCDADPNGHIVSYEGEHSHPMPALVRKGRTTGVKKNKPLPDKIPAVAEAPPAPPPPATASLSPATVLPPQSPCAPKILAVGDTPQAPTLLAFAPAMRSPFLKFSTVAQAPAPPASAMASPSPNTPPPPAGVQAATAPPPSATTASLWDTPPAPSLRASASASAPSQFLKIPAAEEKRQAPAPLASFASAWLSATMLLRAPSAEFDGGDLITLGKLPDDAGMKKTSEDSVLIVISDDEEDQDDVVVPTPEELAPVYCDDVEENMKFPMPYELAQGSSGGHNNNLMMLPMPNQPAPSSSGGDGSTSTDVGAGTAPVRAPIANVADETLVFNPWGFWA